MPQIIRDLLTPEAQRDPHHWAATFGGHCWIGVGLWGIIAIGIDRWSAAWIVPLLYLIVWEGLQLAMTKKRTAALIWDGILDATAVAFACIAAAYLSDGNIYGAIACWGASAGVMATGWKVRG